MAVEQKAPSIQKGFQARLLSDNIKLKDKLNLAVNVAKSNLRFPNKEKIILDWFLVVLEAKYTEDSWKKSELNKFWEGLLQVLGKVNVEKPILLKSDVLIKIVELIDLTTEVIAECFKILLTILAQQSNDVSNVLILLDKLHNKDCTASLLQTMVQTLDKISRIAQLPSENRVGMLLAKFSLNSATRTSETLLNLLRTTFFKKTEQYQDFFYSISLSDGDKYTPSGEIETLIEYITGGGDLSLLFACLKNQSAPAWLKAHLFCLSAHLEGFTGVYSPDSVVLAQLAVGATPSLDRVVKLVLNALPLDVSLTIGGEKLGKHLTGLVKFCVEKYGMSTGVSTILQCIFNNHPLVLEPLVGYVLAGYLQASEAPVAVFQIILDLMLKLRQLPKIVSKLLIYLRTQTNLDLAWNKQDLELFGEAVSKVPRVQSIEIWKMLHYHVTADCIPALGESAGTAFWRVTAPLLSTVLAFAHLSDHNIPEPLSIRVRDLVKSTLGDVLDKLFDHDFRSEDKPLYCNLVSSLFDLTELITAYRGREFEEVCTFKKKYIERLLKVKDFANNSQLIIQTLRSNSGSNAQLWKSFRRQLLGDQDCFKQIFDIIPVEYLGEVNLLSNVPDVAENQTYSALLLYSHFSAADSRILTPVVKLELWTSPENWYSLQSQLGKVLQNSLQQIHEMKVGSIKPGSLEGLENLPVESLPEVQKLGLTVLCINHLFATEGTVDERLTNLLARCFEDTNLFRFINSSNFLERVLSLKFPSTVFIEALSFGLSKYTKMLCEITENFGRFQDQISQGDDNTFTLFVSLLEHLSRPILDTGVASEKKASSIELAKKISKCVARYGRKEELLSPTPLLLRSAAVMVKLHCKAEEKEDLGKAEKFIRKVLDNSLALETVEVLGLVNQLIEAEPGLLILTQEYKEIATKIALDNVDCEASCVFISQLLGNSDPAQIEKIFQSSQKPDNLLKLSKIILSAKISEETKLALRPFLEDLTFNIISNYAIDLSDRNNFVERLISCSPALVSINVETAALSSLLSNDLSARTFKPFITFLNNHPKASVKQIPFLCVAVQHHLHFIETNCDADNFPLASAIQSFFGSCKRKKEDWANVAPYLIADLLNATVNLSQLNVKQTLIQAANLLLGLCSSHSHEYLSANLPQATNEIFKIVLHDFKVHHKFTGKNV